MQITKYPRGREHARAIDATPISSSEYSEHPAEPQPVPVNGAGDTWAGWRATDEIGRTSGHIEGRAGEAWLIVRDRRGRRHVVPSAGAIGGGDSVFLPYSHDHLEAAPVVSKGTTTLDAATLDAARKHYGT